MDILVSLNLLLQKLAFIIKDNLLFFKVLFQFQNIEMTDEAAQMILFSKKVNSDDISFSSGPGFRMSCYDIQIYLT